MKKLYSLVLLAAIFLFWLAPFAAVSVHAAASNGHIFGQLLDGSNKNAPLPSQPVTLQIAQNNSGKDLNTLNTDAQGAFSFDNLATDKNSKYAVYIRYQGAQYTSDPIALDSKPDQQVNLTVYQATTSSANIAITRATLLIHEPDKQTNTVTISEVISFKNLDTHTYVGSLDGSKGKPNALLFSLPPAVRQINLGSGFSGYQMIQVDRGFATNAALYPGDNDFAFSFDVPYTGSSYAFDYVTMYPTVSVEALIVPDLQVTASGLQAQGEMTAADQQSYRLFKNKDLLLANQSIHLSLSGLPQPAAVSTPDPLNSTAILLIVAVLLMFAIIFITWFLYRFRRRQAVVGVQEGSISKQTITPVASAVKKAPGDRKQELLQELLDLDQAYEAGKLTKPIYEQRRGKTKARLRTLISEQEMAAR